MDKKSTTLLNVTPTEAEKQLYQYAGFYIVEKDRAGTDAEYLKYAVCHTNDSLRESFPKMFTIPSNAIDYDNTIIFDCLNKEMRLSCYADAHVLKLILERAKELGWSSV